VALAFADLVNSAGWEASGDNRGLSREGVKPSEGSVSVPATLA